MSANWSTVPLRTVCTIKNGKSDTADAVQDGLYAFFDRSKLPKRSNRYLFDCEALIIPGEGTEFLPRHFIGKFDLHQRAYALHSFAQNLDPRFLFYYLLHQKDYWPRVAVGATVKSLRMRHFEELPLRITSRTEQERIVAILDQAFSKIETQLAIVNEQIATQVVFFESLLDSALRPDDLEWTTETFGDVCRIANGSQPPKSTFSAVGGNGMVRLIQIRDYKSNNHIVYIEKRFARSRCETDDVMIGRYGPPVFQILRGLSGAYNVALMKAVPNEKKVTKDFVFYFLQQRNLRNLIVSESERASGQTGVRKELLESYPFAYPSLDKQRKIVADITSIQSHLESRKAILRGKVANLNALKESILQQAFSGNL